MKGALSEAQIRAIDRFPEQNPNPVMRISDAGRVLYANPASGPILAALGVSVGDALPENVRAELGMAPADPSAADPSAHPSAAGPSVPRVRIEADRRTYSILAVPIPDLGFVNLYGTDITAAQVINKFPDMNPNPVLRVSEDGDLLYANSASRQLIEGLGLTIGAPLPAEILESILSSLDGSFELSSDGRTYSLHPVRIREFDFINVYGTDVTAVKAINKFPDQNPNPVFRLSKEGRLLYANRASRPIISILGARVGARVPAGIHRAILDRAEGHSDAAIEITCQGGRLFSISPVWVHEFGFINVYGTDITAARELELAHRENERLLLNILPEPIARRLRQGETLIADRFDDVTLLFADIVDFTRLSSRLAPAEVVDILNDVFSLFDRLVDKYGLEKIKTIGDAYILVGGMPETTLDHTARVADMALELLTELEAMRPRSAHAVRFRIGIHAGPAVAGVIGVKKFIYDIWGDTVNLASRMESQGVPGRIHVSHVVYERLVERYEFEPRGFIDVRGKGPMATYFLTGRAIAASDRVVSASQPQPTGA